MQPTHDPLPWQRLTGLARDTPAPEAAAMEWTLAVAAAAPAPLPPSWAAVLDTVRLVREVLRWAAAATPPLAQQSTTEAWAAAVRGLPKLEAAVEAIRKWRGAGCPPPGPPKSALQWLSAGVSVVLAAPAEPEALRSLQVLRAPRTLLELAALLAAGDGPAVAKRQHASSMVQGAWLTLQLQLPWAAQLRLWAAAPQPWLAAAMDAAGRRHNQQRGGGAAAAFRGGALDGKQQRQQGHDVSTEDLPWRGTAAA